MAEKLNQLDTALFLWLNGRYAPWLDPIMVWVTERNNWFPFYALLIGWLIYRYRKQAIAHYMTIAAAVPWPTRWLRRYSNPSPTGCAPAMNLPFKS